MEQTLQVLRKALEAAPDQWDTRRHLAELLLERGRREEAVSLIRQAPRIPEEADAALFAADLLLSADAGRAMQLADAVLAAAPDHPRAHALKARFYRLLGQAAPAAEHHARATAADPSLADPSLEEWLRAAQPPAPSRPTPPPPRRKQDPAAEQSGAEASALSPAPPPAAPAPKRTLPPPPRRPAASGPAEPAAQAADTPAEAPPSPPPAPAGATTAPPSQTRGLVRPGAALTASAQRRLGASSRGARKKAVRPARKAPARALAFHQPVPHEAVEAVVATDRKRGKAMAFLGAGILHALALLLFLIWVLGTPYIPDPVIVVRAEPPPQAEENPRMKALQQKLPQKPSSSSSARAKVITADTTSPVVAPEVDDLTLTDEPLGAGDSFGYGSGWGDGDGSGGGGGVVQFFGEKQKAKRVAYIVDFSFSMSSQVAGGTTRIDTLKDELIDSIKKLPPTLQFNIIYFSGAGWIAGEDPSGGSFQERLQQSMQGESPKLQIPWLTADSKIKKEQQGIIEAMPLAGQETGGGTMWAPPLRLALQMRPLPDLIYLLTDGAAHDSHTFVANLNTLNPTKIPIHTIALELPGDTAKKLADVADQTGGQFTIVLDGKLYTGDRARSYTDPKFNPVQ